MLRSSSSRKLAAQLPATALCRAWTRALAAQPQRSPPAEYEARTHSVAFKVGGLVGRGVASIRRQARETGALDAASKLKDDGFRAAGVDKATGDTALKAAGGLWVLARTAHKVRKVAVGAVIAGAAYGVARAHSPKTADRYGSRRATSLLHCFAHTKTKQSSWQTVSWRRARSGWRKAVRWAFRSGVE